MWHSFESEEFPTRLAACIFFCDNDHEQVKDDAQITQSLKKEQSTADSPIPQPISKKPRPTNMVGTYF